MNSKKESILYSELFQFMKLLEDLSDCYSSISWNDAKVMKLVVLLERQACRIITHYEDWTTINTDLEYDKRIKSRLISNLVCDGKVKIHVNLQQVIQEQYTLDSMYYYTYKLLHTKSGII